ncbi:hypothetical protein FKW77_001144 [Venturia effusa]|uniref:Uncharacterized protein n=1 Tax=Venturia effusa TaxID=50376 RepID=A0A517LES0_9PEZI|nr:hypothetical protein FKW77_001144 [Venturia effusa]
MRLRPGPPPLHSYNIVLYPVWCIIYNLFFHPLRKFPGPKLAAATQLYTSYANCRGRPFQHLKALHDKYGEVVRVKPNELSFITDTIWRDVYMHRQGKPQMVKTNRDCFEEDPNLHNIISGDDDTHARHRRAVAHAFSDKALKAQEPLIQRYIDMLVDILRDEARKGGPFDIIERINWTSFDIIGDLAFGEPFGALASRQSHVWMTNFFKATQMGCVMNEILEFAGSWRDFLLRQVIVPLMVSNATMSDFATHKIEARLERGVGEKPDLMAYLLKHNDEGKGMSKREIVSTFNIIVVAGAETVGTALSGTLWLLMKNPSAMKKLKEELYAAFENDKDINLAKTYQLPYLNAVIQEALRAYATAANSLRRTVEPGGANISGYDVPGGTFVGMPHPVAYVSPRNFSEPKSFIPERWIDTSNPRFANDKRSVFRPFSAGPRNCVGQNLANSEIRMILARLVYNFDFELEDPGFDWADQGAKVIRMKPPLVVRAREVQHGVELSCVKDDCENGFSQVLLKVKEHRAEFMKAQHYPKARLIFPQSSAPEDTLSSVVDQSVTPGFKRE